MKKKRKNLDQIHHVCMYLKEKKFLVVKINSQTIQGIEQIQLFNERKEWIASLIQSKNAEAGNPWIFQGYVKEDVITDKLLLNIVTDEGKNVIRKTLNVSMIDGKTTFQGIDSNLIICRPFLPDKASESLDSNFYFVDPYFVDLLSMQEICKVYSLIYMEHSIAECLGENMALLEGNITVIEDFTKKTDHKNTNVRIAFLASSDTHVHFMLRLAQEIPEHLFVIPDRTCKDDSAAFALEQAGVRYVEIHYQADACDALMEFAPHYIFCAADWTSEFIALQRIIKNTGIRTISMQEGPQDWHTRFYQNIRGKEVLKVLNHYRNADILFAQGARTLEFIRPKYFSVTGNNKIDHIERHPLPPKPKVLINCNFTYVETKPPYESRRDIWMQSVLRVCKELGVSYMISKHPRDLSEWDDPNLIQSNAFKIKDQLLDCSISISRFSSIPYETLSFSRKAIYYNNHLEPMPSFTEDIEGEVLILTKEEELRQALKEHIRNYPYTMDDEKVDRYLHRHVGPQDGNAVCRLISMLQMIGRYQADTGRLKDILGKNYQIESVGCKKTAAVYVRNSATNYSGGRYHGWMLAEALCAMGHKVYVVTDHYPVFYSDFKRIKSHQKIEVVLTYNFIDVFAKEKIDFVFCIPGMDKHKDFYSNVVKLSKEKRAPLALLNFESPNWFNIYSPYKKNAQDWHYWDYVSENADVILASAEESVRFAKEYYGKINGQLSYEAAYPSINTVVCDAVPEQKKEKRILLITRYNGSEHKGTYHIVSILSERMRGYTLVLIIGTGEMPLDIKNRLEETCASFGIGLEIKRKISDFEKFMELKRASLLIFPSFFEGYGYPPVEALYCNTACVAFELPVLRETCEESITFVPLGNYQKLKEAICHVIDKIENNEISGQQEFIRDKASFASFAIRLDKILQKYDSKKMSGSRNAAEPVQSPKPCLVPAQQAGIRMQIKIWIVKAAGKILGRETYEKYRAVYHRLRGR